MESYCIALQVNLDFEAYKSAYRSGLPVKGRRERLHEHMQQVKRITHPLAQAS